jgi:hypothetical protein
VEFGEDCIQKRWSDVALDLDGAVEQQGAHGAPGEAGHERPRYNLLSMISNVSNPSAYKPPEANQLPKQAISLTKTLSLTNQKLLLILGACASLLPVVLAKHPAVHDR